MQHLDEQVWTLLQNDLFLRWTLSADETTTAFWEKWMEEHPDRPGLVRRAQEIIRELSSLENPKDTEQFSADIWADVQARLTTTTPDMAVIRPRATISRRWLYWAAACLLGLIITGTVLRYHNPHNQQVSPQVATHVIDQDLLRTNFSATDREVLLVDGSTVILQPGASIRHAAFLEKDKREVYLEGNAFFEIAKDADRPFYVYTKDLVVRVLGTSFNVTTNKDNGDVTVLVQSGKVAVSKKTNPAHQPLILVSNQQVLYKEQTHDLVQANPATEKVTSYRSSTATSTPFNFEEAPVADIFRTLENAYAIVLHYDQKTFSACAVTTSLTDETFEEKLKIICEAIGATYTIKDNEVFIDGKPCK